MDGNVLRVFARLYNDPRLVTDPQVKREFTARVMEHQPPAKAGDYNQALMELGDVYKRQPNGLPRRQGPACSAPPGRGSASGP